MNQGERGLHPQGVERAWAKLQRSHCKPAGMKSSLAMVGPAPHPGKRPLQGSVPCSHLTSFQWDNEQTVLERSAPFQEADEAKRESGNTFFFFFQFFTLFFYIILGKPGKISRF